MGNNGFSYSSRLANSTIFATNPGESEHKQNVGQERQAAFSGRPTTVSEQDPAETFLA